MSVYIGKNIISLETVDSTNNYARELLKDKHVPDGTIIVSKDQTIGRGYADNSWESESGKNLTFSIVLYPEYIPPEEQFNISRAVSLGICDYLRTFLDEVTIKWPNDIYVQDRKIAGILIENSISGSSIFHSIIGIGLNVNQVVFRSNAPNPTSIKLRAAQEFSLYTALRTIVCFIENRFLQLETDRSYSIYDDYIHSLYRYNEEHIFEKNGERFKGKIIDVEETGILIIEAEDGSIYHFRFKEVSYVR
jgi:BirA family biotin operon repressor/biotin-[acetyl-CoA-carboxylase] ligase